MKKVIVLVAALLVTGCANQKISAGGLVGAAIGAAAGGFVGAQFGGGLGQALMATVGVLGGGAAGYTIGKQLLPSDQAYFDRTAHEALSWANDGDIRAWSNPETGNGGIVAPGASFVAASGHQCRRYRSTFAVDRAIYRGGGTACLANGEWRPALGDGFG